MRQTWSVFLDAYRELNAKKLFWVVMILSGMVVVLFGCVGLTPKGVSFLWWEFPSSLFNSSMVSPATYYKFLFQSFGVKFWLGWLSTILALVATCGRRP